jgi:hypothetical protein
VETADGDIGGIDCAGENGVDILLAGAGDLVRESPSPKTESTGSCRTSRASAVDEPEFTGSRRRTTVEEGYALAHAERRRRG